MKIFVLHIFHLNYHYVVCILGMRFAMLEMKLALATFLYHYEVQPSVKTKTILQLDPAAFILAPKNGIWLKIVPKKLICENRSI